MVIAAGLALRRRAAPAVLGRRWYRVLFFGSDAFAAPFLEHLWHEKQRGNPAVTHLEAVTPPDARIGRHRKTLHEAEVKVAARRLGIPCHDAPRKPGRMTEFTVPQAQSRVSPTFDVGVVVSFPYFLTPNVIDAFPRGLVNFHPSLLPKYRGAAPLQHTILNDDAETGYSIIEISKDAFDVGDILVQERMTVPPRSTFESLSKEFQRVGPPALSHGLANLDRLRAQRVKQADQASSKAPKIGRDMTEVSLLRDTAAHIDRKHRAISHHACSTDKRLLLIDMHLADDEPASPASFEQKKNAMKPGDGFLHNADNRLWLRATAGWLIVNALQVENKAILTPRDFINGYKLPRFDPFVFESNASHPASTSM